VFITAFAAGVFQTNCYVIAEGDGGDAVVIDPGQDAAPRVREILAEHRLTPVAVFLTHGHLDHTWNAQELADEYAVPVYVHADDRGMLSDPGEGLGNALAAVIGTAVFREPQKVIEFVDGEDLEVAGLRWRVDHAPGHTRGSVLLSTEVPTPDGIVLPGHGPQTSVGAERAGNPFLQDVQAEPKKGRS
jgi:hydroxyacylglutathione hydrolase